MAHPITQVGVTTTTGDAASTSSRAPAVPTGAQEYDVAFVFLDVWEAIDPAINVPLGFQLLYKLPGGSGGKSYCYWKRLSGPDSGTYSFSWSGTMWATAHCTMLRGVKKTGDPVGANYATALAISDTFPSVTVTPPYVPALLWHGYNDSGGTHTPPTGFTETADVDCATDAIQFPESGVSWTASGAKVTASSAIKSALVAVEAESGGEDNPGTLSALIPLVTGSISGTLRNSGSVQGSIPKLLASLTGSTINKGTLSSTIPKLRSSLTGSSINNGVLDASFPRVQSSINGALINAGSLDVTLSPVRSLITGTTTNVGLLTGSLPVVTGHITGVSPNRGTLIGVVPRLTGSVSGTLVNPGIIYGTIPLLTGHIKTARPTPKPFSVFIIERSRTFSAAERPRTITIREVL